MSTKQIYDSVKMSGNWSTHKAWRSNHAKTCFQITIHLQKLGGFVYNYGTQFDDLSYNLTFTGGIVAL